MVSGSEKRAHARAAVQLKAQVKNSAGVTLEAIVENLGALGALLSTLDLESALEVGDRVTVTVGDGDAGPVAAEGEVLRLEQEFADGDIRRTFAVRFDDELTLQGP